MKNIEIKLVVSEDGALNVFELINQKLEAPLSYNTIKISKAIDLEDLTKKLNDKYDVSVRNGTEDGCYGSRPGTSQKGLTLWLHASSYIDRYVDSEYGEQVNPWTLLEENGQQVNDFESEDEIERFLSNCDKLGLSVIAENTYNYATDYGSKNSDCAGFMYDFNFEVIENKDRPDAGVFMVVMFHCGGDPRGNYTSKKVWFFDSIDEVYSVIHPMKQLSDAG
jgi:hypothetical protein